MIILLAGIQGISPTYYEAAEIDGAGVVAKFFQHHAAAGYSVPVLHSDMTGLIGAFARSSIRSS